MSELNIKEILSVLDDAEDIIEFHVGSSHSDTGKEDERVLNNITKLIKKLNKL